MREGRHEEGVALLRNSLVAAELNELDNPTFELASLTALIKAFFTAHAIDEAEPLVLRHREAAEARSETQGGVCSAALESVLFHARLHEVLAPRWQRLLTPRVLSQAPPNSVSLKTPPHCSAPASSQDEQLLPVNLRFHHARETTRALVEPSASCRHAGSLKRPRGRCALCST